MSIRPELQLLSPKKLLEWDSIEKNFEKYFNPLRLQWDAKVAQMQEWGCVFLKCQPIAASILLHYNHLLEYKRCTSSIAMGIIFERSFLSVESYPTSSSSPGRGINAKFRKNVRICWIVKSKNSGFINECAETGKNKNCAAKFTAFLTKKFRIHNQNFRHHIHH